MNLQGPLQGALPIMSRVSNLVNNHLESIVDNIKKDHLLKRPQDRKLLGPIMDGFYSSIRNLQGGNKSGIFTKNKGWYRK